MECMSTLNFFTPDFIAHYWGRTEVTTNLIVFANVFGAFLLGLILGYERSYHGRAAGMRTYALVCMSSCAVTVAVGYPEFWYGGTNPAQINSAAQLVADPTRVLQGVLTGIGFLCAGVIMKDGTNIKGLTTSASIWTSSVIGVLVGLGFYAAAMLITLLSIGLMIWTVRIEKWLPSQQSLSVTLKFDKSFSPKEDVLRKLAQDRGYNIPPGSIQIHFAKGCQEWRYIAVAPDKTKTTPISKMAEELAAFPGIKEFDLAVTRA
jgi:putative Mg2+ transporter-C (MgtC) family protein